MSAARAEPETGHLFFSLPLGMTKVVGGIMRSDPAAGLEGALGALVSFLGFFVILLLR